MEYINTALKKHTEFKGQNTRNFNELIQKNTAELKRWFFSCLVVSYFILKTAPRQCDFVSEKKDRFPV